MRSPPDCPLSAKRAVLVLFRRILTSSVARSLVAPMRSIMRRAGSSAAGANFASKADSPGRSRASRSMPSEPRGAAAAVEMRPLALSEAPPNSPTLKRSTVRPPGSKVSLALTLRASVPAIVARPISARARLRLAFELGVAERGLREIEHAVDIELGGGELVVEPRCELRDRPRSTSRPSTVLRCRPRASSRSSAIFSAPSAISARSRIAFAGPSRGAGIVAASAPPATTPRAPLPEFVAQPLHVPDLPSCSPPAAPVGGAWGGARRRDGTNLRAFVPQVRQVRGEVRSDRCARSW